MAGASLAEGVSRRLVVSGLLVAPFVERLPMQTNFDAALAFTIGPPGLGQEGGFSNLPHDPGGATYRGITLAEFRTFRGDSTLTADDLQQLNQNELEEIYNDNYWTVVRGDVLPVGVDLSVFDMSVNAGTHTSAILLQHCLPANIIPDGVIGPHTLAAASSANPRALLSMLWYRHQGYYKSLSTFRYFGTDWLRRAEQRYYAGMMLLSGPSSARSAKATP